MHLFYLSTLKHTDTLMRYQNKAKGPIKANSQIFLQTSLTFDDKIMFTCYFAAVKTTQNTSIIGKY